jgi:anti-sigma-K factor RskA
MSDTPDSPEMLAGEYVMGLLDGSEMLAVRRQALSDQRLAGAIGDWEKRLYPIVDLVPSVAPPAALWPRIEREITADGVGDAADPSVVPLRPSAPSGRSVWSRPNIWRATTAASLALAAAFAAIAFLPRPVEPLSLAAIVPLAGQPAAFLAESRPDGRIVIVAVSPGPVPADRDLELWLLRPGETRPTSLGVLPVDGKSVVLPTAPPPGSQLLISVEAKGGSRTGLPSSTIPYGGALSPPVHT